MTAAVAAFAFAPGLAVGSFLNVVAARVPLKRSIVFPASACMECGTELAWRDNVPLLSWVLLRGRCRSCGVRISPAYPLVELATAVLVVASILRYGLTADAAVASCFCALLVVLSAIDVQYQIVPNRIVLPAAGVALAAQTALHPSPEWALCALGAAGFLFALALAYPAGLGMGDVKLALVLGAVLGRDVVVAIMLGTIFALVPSVVMLARHGSAARKMRIPFVPFLALGSIVALFAGQQLLGLYLGLL